MKFWERLREILRFRWLDGKPGQKEKEKRDAKSGSRRTYEDVGTPRRYSSGRTYRSPYQDRTRSRRGQSLNEFHEEQDDYDMMDDF